MIATGTIGTATLISLVALGLSGFSLYWQNLRRGRLRAPAPEICASTSGQGLLELVLPLPLLNTGGSTVVVAGLRATIIGQDLLGGRVHLDWLGTTPSLYQGREDRQKPDSFAILRGESKVVNAWFYERNAFADSKSPAGKKLRVVVEGRMLKRAVPSIAGKRSGATYWKPFLEFDWWPPLHEASYGLIHYVAGGGCIEGRCDGLNPEHARARVD